MGAGSWRAPATVLGRTDDLVARDSTAWKCHVYDEAKGEDDDWCKSAGTHGGWQYEFVGYDGPKAGLCEKCWCCKREVEALATEVGVKADNKTEGHEKKAASTSKEHEAAS